MEKETAFAPLPRESDGATAGGALSGRGVRAALGEVRIVGRRIDCFASIDSTNDYLKRIAADGAPDGTVAVAAEQTAGRGRRGRSFQSAADQGVYLSALLRPQLGAGALLPLTGLCAAAMCSAVERVCAVRPKIKWTNDLVLNGKKLCGILTEMSLEAETGRLQYLVVGIGVNVLHEAVDFSPEVAEIATSLQMQLGHPVSRPALAAAMIEGLDRLYTALKTGNLSAYLAAYRRDCVNLGKTVQLLGTQGRETVTAVGIDDEFGLVVRAADGTEKTVRSGEVSVRGLYGYVE